MSDDKRARLAQILSARQTVAGAPERKRVVPGQFEEVRAFNDMLAGLRGAGAEPSFFEHRDPASVDYTAYDYLGFAHDERVKTAAIEAIRTHGTSVGASRVVGGQLDLHAQLEAGISTLLGTDDAVVFVSGHATNVTTIGHLLRSSDLILHDALAHNSIVQGAILAGARRLSFAHSDAAHARRLLEAHRDSYDRVLLVIEGVYSMDGDVAPLPEFVALRDEFATLLMVDEAHSLGTLGSNGRGIGEHFGVGAKDVDLWMGTLSKTLGSCGGYIAGDEAMVGYLRYTAPGFLFSVGMTPGDAAAAGAACALLDKEGAQRASTLRVNIDAFFDAAETAGLDVGPRHGTPVIPYLVGASTDCVKLANRLRSRGIGVHPMIYPAVAESEARLRFFITARHTLEDIRETVAALAEAAAN